MERKRERDTLSPPSVLAAIQSALKFYPGMSGGPIVFFTPAGALTDDNGTESSGPSSWYCSCLPCRFAVI
ncbi:GL14430 [Drosophila persimilis]|uniref:GL14430 n=1 Tax=Drosophila persimilis TaxID=7234 RepID=B4GTV6_DROPE|nr:GL14430 [Drosophila persimilis]